MIGPEKGPVKIGFSTCSHARIRALQTGHPYKISVLAQMPGGQNEETAVHEFFRDERIRLDGEWFVRTKRVCRFIELLNSGLPVPLALERMRVRTRRDRDLVTLTKVIAERHP